MTEQEAFEYVRSCGEDEGPETREDAVEIFEAVFDCKLDADDTRDHLELWSLVCSAVGSEPCPK